jgi:hypothetical protein
MVGLYRGGLTAPSEVVFARAIDGKGWIQGQDYRIKKDTGWMRGGRLGMDLRDVTRSQGLMDAGCMDGKRRSESVRGVWSEVEGDERERRPLARKRRVAAETGTGQGQSVVRGGGRKEETR